MKVGGERGRVSSCPIASTADFKIKELSEYPATINESDIKFLDSATESIRGVVTVDAVLDDAGECLGAGGFTSCIKSCDVALGLLTGGATGVREDVGDIGGEL